MDADFGARGDWHRDPDGDDGNAGDVIGRTALTTTQWRHEKTPLAPAADGTCSGWRFGSC